MKILALALLAAAPLQDEAPVYESMIVPFAANGLTDWAPSDEKPRHVLNVTLEGRILYLGRVLYEPEVHDALPDPLVHLKAGLKEIAARMPQAPLREGGPPAPQGALLIRADLIGGFATVSRIIESGAGLFLSEYHLAVADMRTPVFDAKGGLKAMAEPLRYLPIVLPGDVAHAAAEAESVEILVRVMEPGRKLEASHDVTEDWKGAAGTRFRWDLTQRSLEYQIGPFKTRDRGELQKRLNGLRKFMLETHVTLELRPGVTVGEVAHLLDVLRGLRVPDVRFVASGR